MSSLNNRRRLTALAISLVVHALVIGLLYFLVLERPKPLPQPQELVLIDIGDVSEAKGEEEPEGAMTNEETAVEEVREPKPEPQKLPSTPAPKPSPKPEAKPQPINTQKHEESLKLKQAEEAKRREEAEQARRQAEEALKAKREAEAKARAEQIAREQEARKREAGNSVANAFGAGRGKNTSHGNGSGVGNHGDVQGSAGGSFSLEGRRIVSNGGRLMPPSVNKAIVGRIVVRIVVDQSGQVTSASVLPRGTTIADASVRSEALKAARSTSFNPQEGAESQSGTITYIYVLKQ